MSQLAPTVAPVALSDTSVDEHPQNVLVNLTGTAADERLVREAGAYVRSTGGRLVLLSVMASREFAGRNEARLRAGLHRYTLCQAEAEGRRVATDAGQEPCSSLGVSSTGVGSVGDEIDCVLAAAREYGCGHVFLVDRQPSGLGRFLTENIVRAVTEGFDGLVTVRRDGRRGTTR